MTNLEIKIVQSVHDNRKTSFWENGFYLLLFFEKRTATRWPYRRLPAVVAGSLLATAPEPAGDGRRRTMNGNGGGG